MSTLPQAILFYTPLADLFTERLCELWAAQIWTVTSLTDRSSYSLFSLGLARPPLSQRVQKFSVKNYMSYKTLDILIRI